ncbi:type VII secretion target [Actinokineospora sp. UTMC 2448]|uniref:type VII secretion target n=1 Tax=Actinokineospora sp. UTMC 2448 TaxID=2268449 RepID=UPI0021644B33|nr:type VII secretion target [Actinokineospora sp. UTMC 2448]UVS82179.1 hypothetical protein Actkin_05944 [Actinokineospora sp. UTMC 2448]
MGQFKVEPDELRGYSELMTRNAQHFLTIKQHAVAKGGDTAGFTGLLTLLHPVVTGIANLYGETLDFANRVMTKDADSLVQAAEAYHRTDTSSGERLNLIEQGLNTLPGVTVAGGGR